MLGAAAQQREVAHVEHKVVLTRERGAQFVEYRDWHIPERTADVAREMLVDLAEVVHGGAVPEVSVRDDADLGQGLERPVDGGPMHLRVLGPDQRRDVVSAQVAIVVDQYSYHQPPGRGDPPTMGPDLVEDRADVS